MEWFLVNLPNKSHAIFLKPTIWLILRIEKFSESLARCSSSAFNRWNHIFKLMASRKIVHELLTKFSNTKVVNLN